MEQQRADQGLSVFRGIDTVNVYRSADTGEVDVIVGQATCVQSFASSSVPAVLVGITLALSTPSIDAVPSRPAIFRAASEGETCRIRGNIFEDAEVSAADADIKDTDTSTEILTSPAGNYGAEENNVSAAIEGIRRLGISAGAFLLVAILGGLLSAALCSALLPIFAVPAFASACLYLTKVVAQVEVAKHKV